LRPGGSSATITARGELRGDGHSLCSKFGKNAHFGFSHAPLRA